MGCNPGRVARRRRVDGTRRPRARHDHHAEDRGAMREIWDSDLSIYGNEAELREALGRGDPYACACLMKRYMPRLYRLALQMTSQPDEAEDVLQESFISACDAVGSFEGRSGLGTWLHRIVLNNALMQLRRRKNHLRSLSGQTGEAGGPRGEEPPSAGPSPSDELLSQELRGQIEAAVLALPDTLRTTFVLRDIEGLSTADAARTLGIGESALKVRLHRARLLLRNQLQEYVAAPPMPAKGEADARHRKR